MKIGNAPNFANGPTDRYYRWEDYGIINHASAEGLQIWTTTLSQFEATYQPKYCVPKSNIASKVPSGETNGSTGETNNSTKKGLTDNINGLLLIGDSITENLIGYIPEELKNEGVTVSALHSTKPSDWVKGTALFNQLPENSDSITALCIMLGGNCTVGYNVSWVEEQATVTMKKVLEDLHEKYPDKLIYVQKVIQQNTPYENHIDQYNEKLAEVCSTLDYTIFIDTSQGIFPDNMLGDGVHPNQEGSRILFNNIKEQILNADTSKEGILAKNPNAFQGAVRIRRVGPNKAVGTYVSLQRNEIDSSNIKNEGQTEEGLGTKEDIPDKIKEKMLKYTTPDEEIFKILSYLTIPYIDFNGVIRTGHMIVNKEIADDVLDLFQELYNIKYPIQKMELPENYISEKSSGVMDQDVEYKSIDDNNTYCFYYKGENGHIDGTAISINPRINPKVSSSGEATHSNAKKYVNREDKDKESWTEVEKQACIDKDSDVYKIFDKYHFTWGGEDETNPNYMLFEIKTEETENTKKTEVDTKIYDLAYVPEETFNKYVENNDSRALKVYTLDEKNQAIIASWSYTTENGLKITKGKTIDFRKALSKYKMPAEYLLAMLMHSEDKEFAEGLADLAINSEYIVSVQDSVRTTQVITTTYNVTEQVTQEGAILTSGSTSSSSTRVSESASQKVEVTYVDCWYVKFAKDYSFSTASLANATSKNGGLNLSGKVGEKIGDFEITAYCGCPSCSGSWGTGTSTGTTCKAGYTIAVDPTVIPYNSYVSINDHIYHAEDTGGAIKGNRIDIYFDTHEEALNWGRQTIPVYWAEVDESEASRANNDNSKNDENGKDDANNANGEDKEKSEKGDSNTTRDPNPLNATARIMAKLTESSSTKSTSSRTETAGPFTGGVVSASIVTSTYITTNTMSVTYDTGNYKISGNAQKFIDLYNSKACKDARRNIEVEWLIESLEENENTAQLVEITEYLFTQADGKTYGSGTLNFEEYKPGEFEKYGAKTGIESLKSFIKYFEQGGEWGIRNEDGTKYKVIDDGYGNLGIGPGIDFYNGGFADEFIQAGYSISYGSEIDVDFVEAVFDRTVREMLSQIEEKFAQYNLTQYQKFALVSRCYNMGVPGGTAGFEQAYESYWNQETDDEYGVTPNEGMYNHPLWTNFFQACPWPEQRGRFEWILFKTGYYWIEGADGYFERQMELCPKSGSGAGGDILEVCRQVTEDMLNRGVQYSLTNLIWGDIEANVDAPYTCCATYVSIVLYKAGLLTADQINAFNFHYTGSGGMPDMLEAAGWTQVSHDEIQPGDVINDPGEHVLIYAGDGLVWDQNTCAVADFNPTPTGEAFPRWFEVYNGKPGVQVWRAP